jgi:hypothetical protein
MVAWGKVARLVWRYAKHESVTRVGFISLAYGLDGRGGTGADGNGTLVCTYLAAGSSSYRASYLSLLSGLCTLYLSLA